MKPRPRHALLLCLPVLAAAMAACWPARQERWLPPPAAPAARPQALLPETAPATPGSLSATGPERAAREPGAGNPFAARSWLAPPPVAPQALAPPPSPPPAPAAPPFPYTYLGKLDDGSQLLFYLARGDRFFALVPGQAFDDAYRLERYEHGRLVFQYLPLAVLQTLALGQEAWGGSP